MPSPEIATTDSEESSSIRLGLKANWQQFGLFVLVNAFVGGMVGLERTILPLIAETTFGMASRTAIFSFLISFGLTKAFVNLIAGRWSDRIGRRPILILGWICGLPVPWLLMPWASTSLPDTWPLRRPPGSPATWLPVTGLDRSRST